MSTVKAFGIGCFNFGVKKNPPFDFKGTTYLKELENCLIKIPNLNNLNIYTDDDFKNLSFKVKNTLPYLEDSGDCFPNPDILDITFDLFIPFQIQAEINETEEKYLDTHSENFKIYIHNNYHFPITIIEVVNPVKEANPSSAVRIVREFLKKVISDNNEKYILFETLGPSPFHLDCYIKPQNPDESNPDWLFNPVETPDKGFDIITFYYNTAKIKDSDEALDYLREYIADELGFYYKYVSFRNEKMHHWSEIQVLLNKLVAIQKIKGIKGFWQKLFKRSSLIGDVFTELAEFEGNDIELSGLRQNEYNEIYHVKDQTFFQPFIDNELNEQINYPIKQISQLVTFFESRRVKSVELLIVLVAALIGGAIGALLTIYYSYDI